MTSSPFERQITEPETAERRTATASSSLADGPQQYPPGPSFLEHDRPAVRLVELPAWLQAFAASVGEPAVDAPEEPQLDLLAEDEMTKQDEPVPETVTNSSPSPARPAPTANTFSSSFISEDDLPEWLRSIAPHDSDDSATETLLFGGADDSEHVSVPNVTRAWTTSADARGVDESTSLFAMVASQPTHGAMPATETAPPQRVPAGRRAASATAPARSSGEAVRASDAPTGMANAEEIVAASLPDTREKPETGVRSGLPMLPIAVAVILLLVLIAVAAALFVL